MIRRPLSVRMARNAHVFMANKLRPLRRWVKTIAPGARIHKEGRWYFVTMYQLVKHKR